MLCCKITTYSNVLRFRLNKFIHKVLCLTRSVNSQTGSFPCARSFNFLLQFSLLARMKEKMQINAVTGAKIHDSRLVSDSRFAMVLSRKNAAIIHKVIFSILAGILDFIMPDLMSTIIRKHRFKRMEKDSNWYISFNVLSRPPHTCWKGITWMMMRT